MKGWRVELLDDVPADQRPSHFQEIEHRFTSLEAAADWLGGPPILSAFEDA